MKSSGIRRGLAVAATSALALAGLAFAPANAQTIDVTTDGADATTLWTPSVAKISTKVDGNGNQTVTLLASASKAFPGGTTNTIRFWTPANPAWLDVHVPVVGGVATFQWTPPVNVGVAVAVNAQAEAAGNLALGAADTIAVNTTTPNANQSVSLDGANRDLLGLYFNGATWTGAVTGKSGTAIGATQVTVDGPGTASAATETQTSGPDGNGLIGYRAEFTVNPTNLVDVNSTDNGTPTDDLVVTAQNGDDSDGRVFSVYRQVIQPGNVTATVRAGSHQNVAGSVPDSYNADDAVTTNDRTFWDLKVVDQHGKAVAGVPVYEANAAGAAFNGVGNIVTNFTTGTGTATSGVTQADGVVQARLDEGTMDFPFFDLDPAAGIQAIYYTVDVNGNGVFDNGTDFLLKITQTNLPQAVATIVGTNSKGLFMDDDESSNFKVAVKDANGDPVQNVAVSIAQHRNNITAGTTVDNILAAGNTDGNGEFTAGFGCAPNNHDIWTEKISTNNGVNATVVIECDKSDINWTPTNYQALNGTSVTAKGVLALPGGQVLPNRTVALTYFPSGNSSFDTAAGAQPTGTVVGTATTGTGTTQADGSFSVKVIDPALPNGQELDSKILAASPGLSIGEPNVLYPAPVGSQVAVSDVADVDFLRSITPTLVTIHNTLGGTSSADGLAPGFSAVLRPGSLGVGNVQAFNSDGVALTNTNVNLTITEGNFVNPASPFEPTPVVDAPVDFSSAGKTITVSTGDSTFGSFLANIERNPGFDDDGNVSDEIHATAGAATDGHDLTWTTNTTPFNPRATNPLVVALSAAQQSSILPKARAGNGNSAQQVDYDVSTYDQFGNPTSQGINPTDNSPVAGIFDPDGGGFESELSLGQPAISAFSPAAATQAINTELVGATKAVYKDNAATSAFDPANPLALINAAVPVDIEADSAPVNWYTVNLNDPSLYTLAQEGSETVPVGSTVSYTLTAIDPEGQPINGSGVGFLRVGPGDQGSDDDGQQTDITNADGQAFYDFAGSVPGTASVSAVVYDDFANGGSFQRLFVVGPDTVTFGGTVVAIHPKLTGANKGSNKDVLTVNSKKAAGASVKLFKKTASGRTLLKTGQLDVNGIKSFTVKDKNGSNVTSYFAIVSNTPRTMKGKTNTVNQK